MSFEICVEKTGALMPRRPFGLCVFFAFAFSFLFSLPASAQPCIIPLANNSIDLKPATCTGTVAYLQGTTPTGGTGTYSYQWESNPNSCGNGGFSPIAGATAKDFAVPSTDAPNTCYRRVVTSGTCTNTSANRQVAASDRTSPVAPTVTLVQPTCVLNTGTITVNTPAPDGLITYSVNGTTYTNTTGIFTLLAPGTYSVTAKYPAGCITPALPVTLNTPAPSGTISPASATICTGSSQVLTATGGTSYQWQRGGTPIVGATSSTYTATAAGTYTVIITNGLCSGPAANSSTVTVIAPPSGSISPASASICNGTPVLLTATGGGTYQWYKDNAVITGAVASTYSTNQPGTYSVVINNGVCSAPAGNTAVITLETPPTGTISPASASICFGSSQLLSATGGSNYQWYKDNTAITGAVASTYSATQTGVYTVDIITSTGCKAKASNSATVTVLPLPTGSISPATATVCAGTTVTLTATGGTSYQWYRDGIQLSGANAATYTANQSGRYAADIFDANSCKGKSSNEAVVTVVPLPSGTISPASAVICPNGSVTLSVSGGTSYQWLLNGSPIAGATGATYTATQAGSYTVEIFSGSCKGNSSNTSVITPVAAPSGSISPASATICTGNTVTLTVNGGTSYQWFKDGTSIAGATGATYNATQTGTYSVTIFSGTCSATAGNTAVITPSTPITFSTAAVDPSCTSATGTITVTSPAGGTGSGYTYSKDNGASFQTASSFTGLVPGTYQIVVKDAAGCKSAPKAVVINSFASTLSATVSTTSITCTQPSGTATVTATGGTGPYQYSLDNGAFQTSNAFGSLSLGAHKITVRDAPGCQFDVNFTITQIASTLAGTAATTNATCGLPNGAVTIQATGGSPDYTYSLDGGAFQTANNFNNLALGNHKVTIKDKVGCSFDVNFEIRQTANPPNLVITNPARICPGASANLLAAGVTAGSDAALVYTYWKDAAATDPLQGANAVVAGTYYIKAGNAAGCSTVKPVTVTAFTVNPGTVTAPRLLACEGDTVVLTATAGRAYQWYRNDTLIAGATKPVLNVAEKGTYSVTIDDGNCVVKAGNTVKMDFQVCIPDSKVFVPTAFTPNRNGANDVLRPVFYHVAQLLYFKVYNRWGQQVFQTNVIGKGWDGNLNGVPQPADGYSWILECVGKNGETIKQSGRSALIR